MGSKLPRGLGLFAVLLLFGRSSHAQSPAEEQARRLLEDGRTYWSQGKFKQALDNFNTIVTGFSNTESAPVALLEIGRYRLEVEGNVEKGRAAFEDVAQRFPQSGGAPGAYYYLGWLTLNHATTPAELDDALAQFNRVQRLYPRSEWVPKAVYASGLVQRKASRLLDAVDLERRVALEYPSSDIAPAAQFQIGHCLALLGEPRQAMEEFQRVRNHSPDSEWATQALDRITALWRLYGLQKPSFALDPAYSVGTGDILKDVRAIVMNSEGTLWIASGKVKGAVPFDRNGKMGASLGGEDLRSLSLSPKGDILVSARLAVRINKDPRAFSIPSDKPGIPEPLERIEAAVEAPGGSLLVADEKKKRVYRFDRQLQYQGTFPDQKERVVSRMLVDGEGGIVMLDREERTVRTYDETGHLLRTLQLKGAGFEVKHPVDVAVDPIRNAYIADEDGGVKVFSPAGQLLTTIGSEEAKKPRAVTIDPSGAVLVYDDKTEKVLRFK